MFAISGWRDLVELHAGSGVTVYRATKESDGKTYVLKVIDDVETHEEGRARLKHEFELGHLFVDCPHIVTYRDQIAFSVDGKQGMALVLDHVPGPTLAARLRAGRLSMEEVFTYAVQMVAALVEVHDHGVVHGDLNPGNFLLGPDGVVLLDFGNAWRCAHGASITAVLGSTTDNYLYIAPEQSGVMSRGYDFRADLYVFGINLFQLLTGEAPFEAVSSRERIYQHLAVTPRLVSELDDSMPKPLAILVAGLLIKDAETRSCQSAQDLLRILTKYQSQWSREKRLTPVELISSTGRVVVSEKFYGREAEIGVISSAIEEVKSGNLCVVAVSGSPGMGKTALVQRSRISVLEHAGCFLSGKFSIDTGCAALSGFVAVFRSLLQEIRRTPADYAELCQALNTRLREQAPMLVEFVPEFEEIFGPQEAVVISGKAKTELLHTACLRFLEVLRDYLSPVVIFLDDWQWADKDSRLLFERICREELRSVLLVVAYRNNKPERLVQIDKELSQLESRQVSVKRIALEPFSREEISTLISDSLYPHPHGDELAEIAKVFPLAAGLPMLAKLLTGMLIRQGALHYTTTGWLCRLKSDLQLPDDVITALQDKLRTLSRQASELLGLLASVVSTEKYCSKEIFRRIVEKLDIAFGPSTELDAILVELQAVGLIVEDGGAYRIMHDRITETVNLKSLPSDRNKYHLAIGLTLQAEVGSKANPLAMVAAHHLNEVSGEMVIEPKTLATTNLLAAEYAKSISGYDAALRFVEAAVAQVCPSCWQTDFDLCYGANALLAELYYLNLRYDEAAKQCYATLEKAKKLTDRYKIYRLLIVLHTMQGQYSEALALARSVLAECDVVLPESDYSISGNVYLKGYNDELMAASDPKSLLMLPRCTDERKAVAVAVLIELIPVAYFTSKELLAFIGIVASYLSYKYGVIPESASAFGTYGFILVNTPAVERGYEFCQLSLALARKLGDETQLPQVYIYLGGYVAYRRVPYRSTRKFLKAGKEVCEQTGNAQHLISFGYLDYGLTYVEYAPLNGLKQELSDAGKFSGRTQNLQMHNIVLAYQLALGRLCSTPLNAEAGRAYPDDASFIVHCQEKGSGLALASFYTISAFCYFLLGDVDKAEEYIVLAEQHKEAIAASSLFYELPFYRALILMRRGLEVSARRDECLGTIAGDVATLERLQADSPENYGAKWLMARAAEQLLRGNNYEARELFEDALHSVEDEHFLPLMGIAHQLIATARRRIAIDRGRDPDRDSVISNHLELAYRAYYQWQAGSVVARLASGYPKIITDAYRRSVRNELSPTGATVSSLDYATIQDATQAFAEITSMTALLGASMENVRRSTGATKVLYFTMDGDGSLSLEVSCGVEGTVLHKEAHAVVRWCSSIMDELLSDDSKTIAICNNAQSKTEEVYIQESGVRSVAAVQIIHQQKPLGVMYLESNLVSDLFTLDKITLIELLARMMALALINTRRFEALTLGKKRLEDVFNHSLPTFTVDLSAVLEAMRANGVVIGQPETLRRFLEEDPGNFEKLRQLSLKGRGKSSRRLPWMNKAAAEMLGIFNAEAAARHIDREHEMPIVQIFRRMLEAMVAGEKAFNTETVMHLPDHSEKHVRVHWRVSGADDGSFAETMIMLHDITPEKMLARTQAEFIAMLTHEIRGPLQAVTGLMQFIEEGVARIARGLSSAQTAKVREDIDVLKLVVRQLLVLSDDVLDFHQMVAGKIELHPRVCSPLALVRAAIQICNLRYKSKGEHVQVMPFDSTELVKFDGNRLQQVVNNLVSNCYKHGGAAAVRVSIKMEKHGDGGGVLMIEIADDGPGMSPEQVERIMKGDPESLTALPSTSTPLAGGDRSHGVGMRVVSRFIRAMGGTFKIESEQGKGSKFVVALPYEGVTTEERANYEAGKKTSPIGSPRLEAKPSKRMLTRKLLVADDDPLMHRVIKQFVARYFESDDGTPVCVFVNNGQEAIEQYKNEPGKYAMILMDKEMPVLDGIRATTILTQELRVKIPVCMLTASSDPASRDAGIAAGARDYLTKPVTLRALKDKILELSQPYLLDSLGERNLPLGAGAAAAALDSGATGGISQDVGGQASAVAMQGLFAVAPAHDQGEPRIVPSPP